MNLLDCTAPSAPWKGERPACCEWGFVRGSLLLYLLLLEEDVGVDTRVVLHELELFGISAHSLPQGVEEARARLRYESDDDRRPLLRHLPSQATTEEEETRCFALRERLSSVKSARGQRETDHCEVNFA